MNWQTSKPGPSADCSEKAKGNSGNNPPGCVLALCGLLFGGCGSSLTTASLDTYKLSEFIGYKGKGTPWFPAGFSLIRDTGATLYHMTNKSTTRAVNGT
jgi:hypothetical protein